MRQVERLLKNACISVEYWFTESRRYRIAFGILLIALSIFATSLGIEPGVHAISPIVFGVPIGLFAIFGKGSVK